MLVEFDFAVTQLAFVKAAMDQIPTFRPDGETPAQVQTRIGTATAVRANYVTRREGEEGARMTRRLSIETLHDACVDFLAQAQNRFRKDPAAKDRLARTPVRDQTFQETLVRADASAEKWALLPLVGTPLAEFVVGQGTGSLSRAGFVALIAAARAADGAVPGAMELFEGAEGDVHRKIEEFRDFSTAALELGRSQFDEGTTEREIIDAIPTEPAGGGGGSTPPPPPPPPPPVLPTAPQNVTVQPGASGSGAVEVGAEPPPAGQNVTSFNIYDADGIQVASTATLPVVVAGFTSGAAVTLTVRAVNAAGEGPASEPVTGTAG